MEFLSFAIKQVRIVFEKPFEFALQSRHFYLIRYVHDRLDQIGHFVVAQQVLIRARAFAILLQEASAHLVALLALDVLSHMGHDFRLKCLDQKELDLFQIVELIAIGTKPTDRFVSVLRIVAVLVQA